jgi:hypothetical protein
MFLALSRTSGADVPKQVGASVGAPWAPFVPASVRHNSITL